MIAACLFFCRKEAESCISNKSEHEVDEAELDQLGHLTIDDIVTLKKGETEKVTTPKGLGVTAAEENEEVLLLRT